MSTNLVIISIVDVVTFNSPPTIVTLCTCAGVYMMIIIIIIIIAAVREEYVVNIRAV